jgi:hypothetical protein
MPLIRYYYFPFYPPSVNVINIFRKNKTGKGMFGLGQSWKQRWMVLNETVGNHALSMDYFEQIGIYVSLPPSVLSGPPKFRATDENSDKSHIVYGLL